MCVPVSLIKITPWFCRYLDELGKVPCLTDKNFSKLSWVLPETRLSLGLSFLSHPKFLCSKSFFLCNLWENQTMWQNLFTGLLISVFFIALRIQKSQKRVKLGRYQCRRVWGIVREKRTWIKYTVFRENHSGLQVLRSSTFKKKKCPFTFITNLN